MSSYRSLSWTSWRQPSFATVDNLMIFLARLLVNSYTMGKHTVHHIFNNTQEYNRSQNTQIHYIYTHTIYFITSNINILDYLCITRLWALSARFWHWYCCRAFLSFCKASAKCTFSRHFCVYCSDNASSSLWTADSSSLTYAHPEKCYTVIFCLVPKHSIVYISGEKNIIMHFMMEKNKTDCTKFCTIILK